MPSRRLAAVVTVVLVIAFVVVAVAPAFASVPASHPGALAFHARLLGSAPKDGSTLETADEVTLEFNEEVDPTFVQVTVEGPEGSQGQGEPEVDGRAVTQALSPDLPAGEHLVTYRVVSTDGHPVSGTVAFRTTAGPSPSPEPTASVTPTPGVTASGAPSPAESAPSATPTSDDASTPWPWVVGGLAVVAALVAVALGLARRSRTPRPDAATAAGDPAPTAAAADAPHPAADGDPFA